MKWILVIVRVPAEPSRHRVAIWRELRVISTTAERITVNCYLLWDEVSREAAGERAAVTRTDVQETVANLGHVANVDRAASHRFDGKLIEL